MGRGRKGAKIKRERYKRDGGDYVDIPDADSDLEDGQVYDISSSGSTISLATQESEAETSESETEYERINPISNNNNKEEDFISLDAEVDTRSRQQKRSEERTDAKRKREIEATFDDAWENQICFPWMNLMDTKRIKKPLSALRLLQKEVNCFIQYLEPTKVEIVLRNYLVHRIRTAITNKWPEAKVTVFGSFSTKLYLPNSDIDMVIEFPPSEQARLRRIAAVLEAEEICRDPRIIEHASVPVIKFEDVMTTLKVDIVLNSTSGVDSAVVINKFIKKYPVIRPISLIVKHLLALRNLNEVFTGGIGGYAIVCLVVSFLQMHPKVASGAIDPMENIGVLLLDFLQLYGINFNLDEVGIDVRGSGSYYDKSRIVCKNGKAVFSIKDPQDASNDIGMKSFNSTSVVRAFKYGYLSMTTRAFELEKELKRNNYKKLDKKTLDNPRKASILSTFLYISTDFIKKRQLMNDVYDEKRWEGQSAAESFSFDL